MSILYPLKFRPRLKARIWGGESLLARKGAYMPRADRGRMIGESWDISCVKGDISVVAGGALKGNNLRELTEVYMGDLTGDKVFDRYGETFPLLIKTLDCHQLLSVQVHPDDELAAMRHNSFGKTEMGYIAEAKPGATMYLGFRNRDITREEYLRAVAEERLPELLNEVEVRKGDIVFIPSGMVHAQGAGIKIIEIQQTADITYRIYDWGRVDSEGRHRQLHTALAMDAIDFGADGNKALIRCAGRRNEAVKAVQCEYFTVNILDLDGTVERIHAADDSFVIYICAEGRAVLTTDSGAVPVGEGESVLVPAEIPEVRLDGKGRLLEVYIE